MLALAVSCHNHDASRRQPSPSDITPMPSHSTVISGRVHDTAGKAVPDARVFFSEGPVPLADVAALSGPAGQFTLSAPAPGSYTVQCVADGFHPRSLTVAVGAGAPAEELKFELSPAK
jgi:hypothetical protein